MSPSAYNSNTPDSPDTSAPAGAATEQSTIFARKTGLLYQAADLLYRRPDLLLALLLLPPLLWFGSVYIASLLALLWQGLYTFDDFTMLVSNSLTLDNYGRLFDPANFDIILRTLLMALAVSAFSAVLAFPVAYYMARYASGRIKTFFYLGVMLPMWTSYIVKAYAWTLLLAQEGVSQWFVHQLGMTPVLDALLAIPGVGGNTLSTSSLGRFLVFTYIWLPFMILPIQASLERLPPSLLQASSDLGATPFKTFRYVILPLSVPGIAAGSIFTFSLTLGDYIVPQLVGPPGLFLGSMVYVQQGSIGNMPMAAAFTLVPIVLIAVYLSIVKRLGAFDAL
jgi:putative spermidine/putrescine transport system permease protein